jgi:hypothetical protein
MGVCCGYPGMEAEYPAGGVAIADDLKERTEALD